MRTAINSLFFVYKENGVKGIRSIQSNFLVWENENKEVFDYYSLMIQLNKEANDYAEQVKETIQEFEKRATVATEKLSKLGLKQI